MDGSQIAGGSVLGQSPTGGNFVGADGAYEVGAITQSISGLTKGSNSAVTFCWAGVQQSGCTGATTEQWIVALGGQSQKTAVLNNASHGFTGWMQQTFTFQATGVTELLSLLAVGTPNGERPSPCSTASRWWTCRSLRAWRMAGGIAALAAFFTIRRRARA